MVALVISEQEGVEGGSNISVMKATDCYSGVESHLGYYATTMFPVLSLCICCLFTTCHAEKATISQHPLLIVDRPDQEAVIKCKQLTTNHDWMYWYHQEKSLRLVASMLKGQSPRYEEDYKDLYTMTMADKNSSLIIKSLKAQSQGVYYCASSMGASSGERQYFGEGTILYVLENGEERKQPEVKVYRPNKKEFKEHNLISLVCVANGFYPEHVRLHWYMNGIKRDDIYPNVPQLNSDNKTYFTSKRLSLTRSEYFNPQNTFKCVAGFIDDESGKINDEIMGEADCSVSREQYGMSINQGKISYIMVMCKSGLYGIIVLFIIWRRKVIAASK